MIRGKKADFVQSSGIPVSDASTVPPTAIDPALLYTLQARLKILAKQLIHMPLLIRRTTTP
jgi:hypothetical protein